MAAQKPLHIEDAADGTIPGRGRGHVLVQGHAGEVAGHDRVQGQGHAPAGGTLDQGLAATHAPARVQGHTLEARAVPAAQKNVNRSPQKSKIRRMEWMRQLLWRKSKWTDLIHVLSPDHVQDLDLSLGQDLSRVASPGPGHAQGLWSEMH